MKKLLYFILPAIMGAVVISSCEKDGLQLAETTDASAKAHIKVGYYSPNPNNNFILKFGETKVGTTFFYSQLNPSDGTAYLAIPSGSGQGRFVLPKSGTTEDSVLINNFNYDLQAGKFYSVFVIDTTTKVRALILKDTLDLPAEGTAKVRFVNTMYNVPAVDVKLSDGTLIAGGLPFGSATNFINLTAAQLYNFKFYNPGTTTQLTGTNAGTFKFDLTAINRRIYTVVLRGVAGSSTTAPVITSITNR